MNREQAGMDKQDILRNYNLNVRTMYREAVSDIRKRLLMMCTARILNNNIEKNYEP